ncbi:hypothetical protein SDC9_114449 [bioreactor metagenome]|uniref:Uncharacterized protein n=1 Tax=bioreactor metagenome TaxID=1076179 RepID=A0A645BQ57_9ZZZZ
MLGLAHLGAAPAPALAHVMVQAGPLPADVAGELAAAGGQTQSGAQSLQNGEGAGAAAEGAEVARAVLGGAAHQGKLGIGLADGQADIGVALAVLEQNVIFGLMALNEGALQHQRLKLRIGQDYIEPADLRDQGAGFFTVAGGVLKILGDPVFQGLGLAHVNDLAHLVQHQVDPRLLGQGAGFFL